MGTADLGTSFTTRKHILTVSTYQMMILLLFNSAEKLSYTEIRNATDIPEGNMTRGEGILFQSLDVRVQVATFFLLLLLLLDKNTTEREREGEEFRRGVSDSVCFFFSFFFFFFWVATDGYR